MPLLPGQVKGSYDLSRWPVTLTWTPGQGHRVGCRAGLSSPSMPPLGEAVTTATAEDGGPAPCLGDECLPSIMGNPSARRSVPAAHVFIYSIVHVYQRGLVGVGFLLWFIIQHYVIHFVVQFFQISVGC